MMLVPRKNSFDLFDDFFEDGFFRRRENNLMKTDIREKNGNYIIDIDLPGFEKENIHLALNNGYLEISAKAKRETNNGEDERFVRKERFYGECSRSFYVGDEIVEEDIQAEFKNGILTIEIPKKEEKKRLSESKQIEIK